MFNTVGNPKSHSSLFRAGVVSAGILLVGLAAAVTASPAEASPSFKCRGNLNAAEWTICGSSGLGQLDREMSSEYFFQRGQLGSRDRNRLRNDQRSWLRQRNSCGSSVGCLRSMYLDRIEQLREWNL